MSHELARKADGNFAFAFLGSRSAIWHGHGQQMSEGAPVEEWAPAAGFDWRIQRSKVRFSTSRDDANGASVWDDNHVIFRSDSKAPLAIVSSNYKVHMQPAEILGFMFEVADLLGGKLDTAGVLFDGRRFFALVKVGEHAVMQRDRIGEYVLISTSCDGSLATELRSTTIRVVCNNTLTAARAGGGVLYRVSHRSQFDRAEAQRVLTRSHEDMTAFMADAEQMASVGINPQARQSFIVRVLDASVILPDGSVDAKKVDAVRDSAAFKNILQLFTPGLGKGNTLDTARGTLWGALNAITEYVDHHARARSAENRFASSQWGPGADLKAHALSVARELIAA